MFFIVGAIASSGLKSGTEEVCAVVVPSDQLSAEAADRQDYIETAIRQEFTALLDDVAPFKRPSRLLIREEPLPKTPTGKIQRQLVSRWINEQGVMQ